MGKRALLFVVVILGIVPTLAAGFGFGKWIMAAKGQVEEAYEVFHQQNTSEINVLLADQGGTAFLLCSIGQERVRFISILPDAMPVGKSRSFGEQYRLEGIKGLKKAIEGSIGCSITGFLEVEFTGFSAVADALGGVKIGQKQYSGKELIAYLQSLPADSAGARAQQEVILAVGRSFSTAGFWKCQNALGKMLKITDTDLSIGTLVKIGKKLIPVLDGQGLEFYCLPGKDGWKLPEAQSITAVF